jgi:multicomponent Na+:H+ antiporter subunit D
MVASSLLNAAYWLPILYLAWFREPRGAAARRARGIALLLVPTLISAAYVLLLGMSARVPGMPFSLAQAAVQVRDGHLGRSA